MPTQTTDGVALQLHASEVFASQAAALRAQQQLFDLLAQGRPVGVSIAGFESATHVEECFSRACELLAVAANEAGAPAAAASLAIDAEVLPPKRLWVLRCEALGPGPTYLLIGRQLTRPSAHAGERQRQDQFWTQYWLLRNRTLLRAALAPLVSSPCPLFAPEFAFGILPPLGIQIPVGTAWATMRINLMDYCDAAGDICAFGLRERVRRCIEYGERFHNDTDWPNASMRHDSWSNRRLAILIDGIGDLAHARRFDPRSLLALQDLGEVIADIREIANEYSRELALTKQHAPSLRIAESDGNASGIVELSAWQKRWQAALQFAATRHRNLLAMSPWSVFPSGLAADCRYSDLLPLLTQADVCAFGEPPSTKSWNINEFKYFHRRLWAVLQQKEAQQMIAEQV